jgi:hypothetical protein
MLILMQESQIGANFVLRINTISFKIYCTSTGLKLNVLLKLIEESGPGGHVLRTAHNCSIVLFLCT